MTVCPNCGQSLTDPGTKICPHCGMDVATAKRSETERTHGGAADFAAATGCVLTGLIYFVCGGAYLELGNLLFAARHGHEEWGTSAHLMTQRSEYMWLGFGLPILITGLSYLLLRRRFPVIARSLGFVCLVTLAVALGAPFLCNR